MAAELTPAFWQDRPTLVTGATGLVGGWVVRRLLELRAEVVCLVRDWVPQSELVRSGMLERVKVVRGDVQDQAVLERVLGEYEVDTVIHLAAQAIVGIANRNPISTFESNVAGTWRLLEACRRSPLVRQVVLASSDKAYGEQTVLPYREDVALQGRHPYDVSKACADLIAKSGKLYNEGPFTPWARHEPGDPQVSTVMFPGAIGGSKTRTAAGRTASGEPASSYVVASVIDVSMLRRGRRGIAA